MNLMGAVHDEKVQAHIPSFGPGDTIRVHVKIKEGEKYRVQVFEGVVISRKRNNVSSTFTVRKVSFGYGIERIFPLHSPIIEKLEVVKSGKVRRARLYYLRERRGKSARLKEVARIDRTAERAPSKDAEEA